MAVNRNTFDMLKHIFGDRIFIPHFIPNAFMLPIVLHAFIARNQPTKTVKRRICFHCRIGKQMLQKIIRFVLSLKSSRYTKRCSKIMGFVKIDAMEHAIKVAFNLMASLKGMPSVNILIDCTFFFAVIAKLY